MRAVWLVAACLLVAGCGAQQPAPPPGDDANASTDNDTEAPDDGTDGSETDGGSESNDSTTNETTDDPEETPMQITSPAFDEDGTIPEKYTRDGANVSPPLNVSGVPEGAESLTVIVDDPDAPQTDPWVHWLIWNIPAQADHIPEGYPPSGDGKAFDGTAQGTNDFGTVKYDGPAPPPSHGEHRYRFTLYALDTTLDLEPGANRTQLDAAIDGNVVEQDRLTGVYER